jgi:hypothetical protein
MKRRNTVAAKKTSKKSKKISKKSTPSNLRPAELAKFGGKQAGTPMEMQKELPALVEQANRHWLARLEKERALASELASKLSAAKSLPDAAKEYQEWMIQRMGMMAEDSQKFYADSQKFMNSAVGLITKGAWPSGST